MDHVIIGGVCAFIALVFWCVAVELDRVGAKKRLFLFVLACSVWSGWAAFSNLMELFTK